MCTYVHLYTFLSLFKGLSQRLCQGLASLSPTEQTTGRNLRELMPQGFIEAEFPLL